MKVCAREVWWVVQPDLELFETPRMRDMWCIESRNHVSTNHGRVREGSTQSNLRWGAYCNTRLARACHPPFPPVM
jgi:hypothetical protein